MVDLGDESFRLKKSFEAADKLGARYILIVGENEVAADAFALKHLASGEQVRFRAPNWRRGYCGNSDLLVALAFDVPCVLCGESLSLTKEERD